MFRKLFCFKYAEAAVSLSNIFFQQTMNTLLKKAGVDVEISEKDTVPDESSGNQVCIPWRFTAYYEGSLEGLIEKSFEGLRGIQNNT